MEQTPRKQSRVRVLGAGMLAGMLLLASCSSAGAGAEEEVDLDPTAVSVDESARDLLPERIANSGELRIATSLQWAPFAYKDEDGNAVGLDIDLTMALAHTLGLEPVLSDVDFPTMVPGVQNNRFDLAVNELQDTEERRAQIQFVHYYQGGMGVLTKQGNSEVQADNLCGHSIGITQGSSAVAVIEEQSAKCVESGEPTIESRVFPDSASTVLAVQNGRAEALVMNNASGQYLTETTAGDLELQPGIIPGSESDVGIVVNKDNDGLAQALGAALETLMEDGWYDRLIEKYRVPDNAIDEVTYSDEG